MEAVATYSETLSEQNERRWDRGAWLTLAAAILILAYPIILGLVAYQYPTDGWTIRTESITIAGGVSRMGTNLSGQPSDLRPGDYIVAINGRELTPNDLPPFPHDLQSGQLVRYSVRRGGEIVSVNVPLVTLTPAAIGRTLTADLQTLVTNILLLLIAGTAFFLRPGMAGPRYMLLAFTYMASTSLGTTYNLYHYTYPPLLTFFTEFESTGWGWLLAPSLTLLALVYPVRKWPLRRFPRLLPAALYGALMLLNALAIVHMILTRDPSPGATILIALNLAAIGLFITTTLVCLTHNFFTVRDPIARAQMLWLSLGIGVGFLLPLLIFFVIVFILGDSPIGDNPWVVGAFAYIQLVMPLSLAIGMVRYRLFDIDVIIRRTTSYAIISGLLALIYFGSIVVLQRLLTPLTGESDAAVVLSTLLIAALFLPMRRRVQDVIDRRFNRTRYNAEKTIEAFAATVRNETDLDALTAELLRVIQQTMEPEFVSIWLRPDPERDHTSGLGSPRSNL